MATKADLLKHIECLEAILKRGVVPDSEEDVAAMAFAIATLEEKARWVGHDTCPATTVAVFTVT